MNTGCRACTQGSIVRIVCVGTTVHVDTLLVLVLTQVEFVVVRYMYIFAFVS